RTYAAIVIFFFFWSGYLTALHSFPTRRSSDLRQPDRVRGTRRPQPRPPRLPRLRRRQAQQPRPLRPQQGQPQRRHLRRQRPTPRSEEHTSELQSRENLVCRLLLEKKKNK